MVYCGKPSRGCQMCRTRRIKCDETKPTCLQCQKSRRQCPGYKDDFDLVFRNETQATERRAKRATTASKKANTQLAQARQRQQQESKLQFPTYQSGAVMSTSSNMSVMSDSSSSVALYSPTSTNSDRYSPLPVISSAASIPGQIDTSMEAQAIHFFLSNWVLLPHQGSNRGYMDFLLPLLRTSPPDSHLSLTFSAVGLAAFANRSSPGMNSKSLLPYAAQKYERALKRTNEALRDPILAKQDSTLASVLLLGLFEQITSCRSNLMGWGSHVDGAVALIKMRGKKQLRTAVGKGLFIAVRTQMAVNCTSSSKPPLLGADFWTTDAMKDPWGQEITRLNLHVAELRAEVNKTMTMAPRTADNMEKVLGLMRRAQNMEDAYTTWQKTLPQEWLPKGSTWMGGNEIEGREAEWLVYPGTIETFTDVWQAGVWQTSRVSRLLLAGIVVRCAAWLCSPSDYRETPEYAAAVSLASEMLAKIISGIPFMLGWGLRDVDGRTTVGMVDNGDFAVGGGGFGSQTALPRALGGFFALWPLFIVSSSDYADDSQRRWVVGRLRWITEEMGVNQAGVLSQFQLRLPSMVIKRDGMGISLPNARDLVKHEGPTGNLPPAARPTTMGKSSNGTFGVKIKVDESPSAGSNTNSIVEKNSPMISDNRKLSTSSSASWGPTIQQQQLHRIPNQDMGQQQKVAQEHRQYSSREHTNNESNWRHASPQTYSISEQQLEPQAQNTSLYSQPLQHQSQGHYSSPSSYHQTSNTGSPSAYSIADTNTASYNTNTCTTPFDPNSNVPGSNINQYTQHDIQHDPRRLSVDSRGNRMNVTDEVDRFFNSPSPSLSTSTGLSPTNAYGICANMTFQKNNMSPQHRFSNSPNRPLSPAQNRTTPSHTMTFIPYNSNSMEFKQEEPSTSTYNDNNNNHNFQNFPGQNPSFTNPWNTAATSSEASNLERRGSNNKMLMQQERLPSNASTMSTEGQNRLDWQIEMVGQEAIKGSGSERSQLGRQLRDLGAQRM